MEGRGVPADPSPFERVGAQISFGYETAVPPHFHSGGDLNSAGDTGRADDWISIWETCVVLCCDAWRAARAQSSKAQSCKMYAESALFD